jgi:apolipoprotein N-acyltransferase
MTPSFLFLLSFFICAFGQPAWTGPLSVLASTCGYAIFLFPFVKGRFTSKHAFVWFFITECIHLSWMTSIRYQGFFILVVYLFLAAALSLQFLILCHFVKRTKLESFLSILAAASLWTLMEWSRLYFISGYTWNPLGLTMSWSIFSLQLATIVGVYGLSFYVVVTNLTMLRAFLQPKRSYAITAVSFCIAPYALGAVMIFQAPKELNHLGAVVIQTDLTPEEKEPYFQPTAHIPPLRQWENILYQLQSHRQEEIDLIVLPEGALPFPAFHSIYSIFEVKQMWQEVFGERAEKDLFSAMSRPLLHPIHYKINNAVLAQALADHFDADVVIGLQDEERKQMYNAAFLFSPTKSLPQRYIKRVLVPIGEYIPFEWCVKIANRFGIHTFFTPGEKADVLIGKSNRYGVSICYEETYPHIIQQTSLQGAELFVNITNDIWFPKSKLAKQHFDHGLLRAVENGIPVLRSTNHGISGGIDAYGRVIDSLLHGDERGSLFLRLPLYKRNTLFSIWGNQCILAISLMSLIFYAIRRLFVTKFQLD